MSAPRDFAELFSRPASWLKGEGPHADMVLSTRIRLARNLSDVPFTHRARDEQLHGVLAAVSSAVQPSKSLAGGLLSTSSPQTLNDSSQGSAMLTPSPRRKVRRERE